MSIIKESKFKIDSSVFEFNESLNYRNPEANWGSSTQGQVFVNAVKQAQVLTETPDHVKNYRPKVTIFSG